MHLKLKDNIVNELHITRKLKSQEQINRINFKYFSKPCDYADNVFIVTFDFTLTSDSDFKVVLIQDFFFESDLSLDDDFWKGSFHKINAPAIAYPFLRAFISTVLLNAGLEAINLPSINFVEMSKKMDKDKSQPNEKL